MAQLRSDTRAKRQRHAAKHCSHCRHHDRAESQQACLVDRFDGCLAFFSLRFQRKVDHHDRVFLHDSNQENDSDQRDDAQIHVSDLEREQRSQAG